MQAPYKVNRVILDSSESPNDGPAAYDVFLKLNSSDAWEKVASGTNGSAVQIISFPEKTASADQSGTDRKEG